jgi:hypothetical protein
MDADNGTNLLQNFPVLTGATGSFPYGILTVTGTLNSEPNATYDVEIFATNSGTSDSAYAGTVSVTTDSNGDGAFAATFEVETGTSGGMMTATATDAFGDTSELSDPIPIEDSAVSVYSIAPDSGPASGGTAVTLNGLGFQPGAGVEFEQTASTGVAVNGPDQIIAPSPALTPGSVSPIVVTNTDLSIGGLARAWFADFLDVPQGDPFHDAVEDLVRGGVTAGCGGGNYCPGATVTRAQVAVFLLKAKHRQHYVPPPCAGLFADVPCPSDYAAWIEQLVAEGIAAGCGGNNYCPNDPVRRDQMAPLLLKTEWGPGFVPGTCQGYFDDVACPSMFADWIERLADETVTVGCGGNDYCPLSPNTRGQMAVFVDKMFVIPLPP